MHGWANTSLTKNTLNEAGCVMCVKRAEVRIIAVIKHRQSIKLLVDFW